MKKYQLIHLTRNPGKHNMTQNLVLSNTTIEPSSTVRYLGIIIDQSLKWWQHVQHVQEKAASTLQALRSLAGSTWGSGLTALRQVYLSIVIPQVLYGCSVWYTPYGERGFWGNIRQALDKIQLEAARIISGAFRATSAPALDVELFLLPMHLQLEKRAQETVVNIRTGQLNPIQKSPVFINTTPSTAPRTTRGQDVSCVVYTSPLKRHLNILEKKLGPEVVSNLEIREAFVVEPWWTPPLVTIEADRSTAERRHKEITSGQNSPLAIYTDGSGIHGKVGAAAVVPTTDLSASAYLGKETTANVYAAELVGILMGLELGIRSNQTMMVVFTDNQAALKTLQAPKRQSGQFIMKRIIMALAEIDSRNAHVEFHWIPAHQGIQGNELADKLAKEATGWRQIRGRGGRSEQIDTDNMAPTPNFLKHLRSATRTELNRQAQKQWAREWNAETRGRGSHALTPVPTRTTLHLHASISKPLSAAIVQMRTGKIGLRDFLHQRHVPGFTDATCQCGMGSETGNLGRKRWQERTDGC
jgi:ribonuclease HI